MPHGTEAAMAPFEEVQTPLPSSEQYGISEPIRSKQAVLSQLGIQLDPKDRVYFNPDPILGLGTTVSVERAPKVTIKDGKRRRTVSTWQPTASALIDEQNIDVGDGDRILPSRDTALTDGLEITIIRVTETDIPVKSVVPFDTQTTEDPNLEKGKQQVIQDGKNGERTKIYHVRREDGEEVSRKLTSDKITTAPVTKRIKKGTKLPFLGSGVATWYSGRGVGPATAASKTIPRGTDVLVTNTANGKKMIVTINDYGPEGAAIDLSKDAFQSIGDIGSGRINVKIEKWIPD